MTPQFRRQRTSLKPEPSRSHTCLARYRLVGAIATSLAILALFSATGATRYGVAKHAVAAASLQDARATNAQEGARHDSRNNDENDADDLESSKNNVPVKWLPDLKVYAGAPATTIELSEITKQLCDEGYFGNEIDPLDPNALVWTIDAGENAENFVDLELQDNNKLLLKWKPERLGRAHIFLKAESKADPEMHAYASFKAECWAPNFLVIFAVALGGGGIFLLGMKKMSDGLVAIAGARLRRLISLFTNNRFLAIGVGFTVTTLVQSSTATSVMTLGFINSGLMTLAQGIGVLLGANIGSTTTGWIFTLNIGALGLPLVGIAAIFYLFVKKNQRIHDLSTFLLGLGLIFFGLETLKEGLAPLPETPQFSYVIQAVRATTLSGVLKSVLVGCVATALAHSSAATLAITITLASLGALDLNTAAAIVLGSNIGTSLTPLIVAIGASANTRRAAYFHVLFNTLGVVWVVAIFFNVFMPTINGLGDQFHLNLMGRIALTHTTFNIINTLVFLPLIHPFARFLDRYVVEKDLAADHWQTLGVKHSSAELAHYPTTSAVVSIERSRSEVSYIFTLAAEQLKSLKNAQLSNYSSVEDKERIFEIEKLLDLEQDETIAFVSALGPILNNTDQTRSAQEQISIADELETFSDYIVDVLKSNLKLQDDELELTDSIKEELATLITPVETMLKFLHDSFRNRRHEKILKPVETQRKLYVAQAKRIRDQFGTVMLSDPKLDKRLYSAVSQQTDLWRRIFSRLLNIAEAMERAHA
ncbi:MAG: Na/Pi cotransporter family protein [Planctomycetia bacterium]|nr:Na/Pi cotransporter family protein [Planctomycetia bacterium]